VYLSDSSKTLHISEVNGTTANVLSLRIIKNFPYRRIVDLIDFKIVRRYDEKSKVITVHLESRDGKTATVCHSLGNYYPVEIPKDIRFSDNLWFQGIRFNKLIQNTEWFFNRRLPYMNEAGLVDFLRNHVNFGEVLGLEDKDLGRITNYLEVRDEVNEESFPILSSRNLETEDLPVQFDFTNMNDVFRSVMEEESKNNIMASMQLQTDSWADIVEDNIQHDFQALEESLDHESNILVTKSFGYKRPKQRKAAYTISNLQQGAELRTRVLDCFFKMSSVKTEPARNLPGYITWINRMSSDNPAFTDLFDALCQHMIKSLSETTGVKQSALRSTIANSSTKIMEIPLRPLHSLIHEEGFIVTQEDFMNDIYKLNEDYQETVSDDEEIN
jgi:hypothetical protein